MKISVKDLTPEVPQRVFREERLDFAYDTLRLAGPVVYDLKISLAGEGVLVQGTAETRFKAHCYRCWKEFELSRSIEVDEVLVLGEEPPKEEEHELHHRDFNLYVGPTGQIDLTDLVFQLLLLSLPSRILCSPGCEGAEAKEKELKVSPFDVLKGLKQ